VFRGPLAGQRPRVVGRLRGDPWLVAAVATLLGLGIVMVFNVSYFYGRERLGDSLYFFRRHLLAVALGTAACVVASRLSSETYRRAAYPLIAALPLVVYEATGAGYRVKRLLAFLNPWHDPRGIGFQLMQSFIAFGSGRLWGVGLGESRQKMFYLPEAHTDFIFSVIGEELGLAGA